MSNLSLNESMSFNKSVQVQDMPSLDQLLNMLGFEEWQIITSKFVLPSLSFVGLILCTLSGWIFFREKFKDPVFFLLSPHLPRLHHTLGTEYPGRFVLYTTIFSQNKHVLDFYIQNRLCLRINSPLTL
jgi:hypothetical protein